MSQPNGLVHAECCSDMQRAAATGREVDNLKESMLYFEGPIQVQGLFEYLYNESQRMCGEDADVPLLMAPAPFPAACLKQQIPKVESLHEMSCYATLKHN